MAITLVAANWDSGTDANYNSGLFGFSLGDYPLAGDLLVVAEIWAQEDGDAALALTPPPGWSMVASSFSQRCGAAIFYRISDGSAGDRFGTPAYTPANPQSYFMANVYRGDAGLVVETTASNQAVDANPLTGSVAGSGAGNQLVLAAAADRGKGSISYDPNFGQLAGAFTAIPAGAPDYQVFEAPFGGFGLFYSQGGGFYAQQDDGGSATAFSCTPGNFSGAPLPGVRPWAVAMLTAREPVAASHGRLTQTALEVAFPASPIPVNTLSHCWDGRAAQLLAYLAAPFQTDLTSRLGALFRAIARELSGCLELVTFNPTTDARAAPGGVTVGFDPVTAVYRVQRVDAFGALLTDYAVGPPNGRTLPVLGTAPVAGDRLSVAYTYQHEGLEARLIEALAQLNLWTAVGEFLDRWGSWFAVPRLAGEADGGYARRIMATVTASRNTRTAILTAVQALAGPSAYMVEWFEALGGAWIWKATGDPVWRGGDAGRHLVWGQTSRFTATDLSLAPCTFAVYFDCAAGISKAQVQAVIDRLKAAGTRGFARCLVSDVPVHLTQTALETASVPISRGRVTQLAIESASLLRIDPASLPNLELYLDSRTLTGLTNGQSLGTWLDSSGLGRHCANAGNVFYRAGASPQGVGLVGIDEPGFLSPGACMTQSAGSLAFTNTRGVTLYIWYKLTAEIALTGDGQDPLLFQVPVAPRLTVHSPGGAITSPADPGHAHFQWATTGGFADAGRGAPGDYTFSLELPAGGTGGNARQNGAAYGPQSVNWSVVFSGNPYSVGDGSNAQWQSAFQVGAIALFSDTHSADIRQGVERFLSDTWG